MHSHRDSLRFAPFTHRLATAEFRADHYDWGNQGRLKKGDTWAQRPTLLRSESPGVRSIPEELADVRERVLLHNFALLVDFGQAFAVADERVPVGQSLDVVGVLKTASYGGIPIQSL